MDVIVSRSVHSYHLHLFVCCLSGVLKESRCSKYHHLRCKLELWENVEVEYSKFTLLSIWGNSDFVILCCNGVSVYYCWVIRGLLGALSWFTTMSHSNIITISSQTNITSSQLWVDLVSSHHIFRYKYLTRQLIMKTEPKISYFTTGTVHYN